MTDWPATVARPLLPAQADDLESALPYMTHPDRRARVPVEVICRRCGRVLGEAAEVAVPDPDHPGQLTAWGTGPLFLGTRKADDDRVTIQQSWAQREGRRARRVNTTASYLASLGSPGLPSSLPLWCDRHGAASVSVGELHHRARQADASRSPQTVRSS